jgi:ABC-2 type transport system ATP-binding protein
MTNSTSTYAIETHSLTKRYGKFTALNDLDIKIESGSCVGFLGPNGAGKTTTIKILTNLIKPTRGRAYVNGVNAVRNPKHALRYIGCVVETPEFYPYLTPMETLEYFGKLRGMPMEEIRRRSYEVVFKVKLWDWRNKHVGTFSKGMKQRLALAQALLHDPQILILDEPTSGLDPRGIVEIREIIRKLRDEGKTIFMSSHILNEVQGLCDTIALIDKGKLLLHDKVENIAQLKATKIIVRATIGATLKNIAVIERIKGVELVEKRGNTIHIHFRGTEKDRAALLKKLHTLKMDVSKFAPEEMSLEDLYLSMIKKSER